MTAEEKRIIEKVKVIVIKELDQDATGHDWWHVNRVHNMAKKIAGLEKTKMNLFVLELGALLHDIADWKFHGGDESIGPRKASEILSDLKVSQSVVNQVAHIVKDISFRGAGVKPSMKSLEGKIVQDADRLDALGAIGIARTFATGASKKSPIHVPGLKPVFHKTFAQYKKGSTSINHFYEKLLLLKNLMNTKAGKRIAESRHEFMKNYLKRFYKEWESKA